MKITLDTHAFQEWTAILETHGKPGVKRANVKLREAVNRILYNIKARQGEHLATGKAFNAIKIHQFAYPFDNATGILAEIGVKESDDPDFFFEEVGRRARAPMPPAPPHYPFDVILEWMQAPGKSFSFDKLHEMHSLAWLIRKKISEFGLPARNSVFANARNKPTLHQEDAQLIMDYCNYAAEMVAQWIAGK